MSNSKQFDLEQQIMECWNITTDLDSLFEECCEGYDSMTVDKVSNITLGMKELYEIKFNKLFRTFEGFLADYYDLRKTVQNLQAIVESHNYEMKLKEQENSAATDSINKHNVSLTRAKKK